MSWIMVQNLKDLVIQLFSQDILDINLDQEWRKKKKSATTPKECRRLEPFF